MSSSPLFREGVQPVPTEPVRNIRIGFAEHIEPPPTPTQASNNFLKRSYDSVNRFLDLHSKIYPAITTVGFSASTAIFVDTGYWPFAIATGIIAAATGIGLIASQIPRRR